MRVQVTNPVIERVSSTLFNVSNINLVKKKYPKLRNKSKPCTFALQYGGTEKTLVKNVGFNIHEAKSLVSNYNTSYHVSKQYAADKLARAAKQGYLDVAFGVRVRTPLLYKFGISLSLSQAEGRSVCNAVSQSYGLLNTRSGTAFLKRVREEGMPVYPCAQIHDAQYFLAPADPELILWVNKHLTDEMRWQDLDEIRHPEVGLSGELDVFRFSWARGHTLKNNASLADVQKVLQPTTGDP